MHFRLIGLIGLLAFLVSFVVFAEPGDAQAALTLNNFGGFETQGTDEAIASAGSPAFESASPIPHSGDWSLSLDAATEAYEFPIITGGSTDSDNDFIFGFWINFADKTPTSDTVILQGQDDTPARLWQMSVQSDGDILFDDNAGTQIGSIITDPFTIGQWHLIEVRWQHLDSGAIDVHIDSSSVLSETGIDMNIGGAIGPDAARYDFNGAAGADFNIDDAYMYSGGTGVGDFLGDAEVFRYQANSNSATSDNDCGQTLRNLDAGVWQDLGETPLSSDATEPQMDPSGTVNHFGAMLTNDTQSGDHYRPGPNGDTNIDGDSNIKGAKWLHRLKRGNGAGTDHHACRGSSTDIEIGPILTLTTDFQNFFHITTDTIVPLSTEYFVNGIGMETGGRSVFGEEIWAFLLHVPDAEAARRIFPVQ